MCRFKSGIIFKNRVEIARGGNDSHSDLLESLGVEDNYLNASKVFVRAELVPVDGEWWVSPEEHPDKWKFFVDQDIIPDWFEKETYEKSFREAVCQWWKEHVLVDRKIELLSSGYYRLKRCEVKRLCDDVKALLDSSQVGEMWDSSQVVEMCGSSQVDKMRDSSQIGEMWDSSRVVEMWGSSQVDKMRDSSQVVEMFDSSTAKDFKNYPNITIWVYQNWKFKVEAHKGRK